MDFEEIVLAIKTWFSKMVFLSSRIDFYEDMATDLANGGREKSFLSKKAKRARIHKLPGATILAVLSQKTESSKGGFAEASKGILPEAERMILVAAWRAGKFEEGLRQAMKAAGVMSEIRLKMIGAALSMTVSIGISAGLLIGWHTKLAPGFTFRGKFPVSNWPSEGQNLYATADFVVHQWAFLLLGLITIISWFMWAKSNWKYNSFGGDVRRFLDKYPPFSFVRDVSAVGFLSALAGLVATGQQMRPSFEQIAKSANPYMRQLIGQMIQKLTTKKNLSEAMNVGLFDLQTAFRIEDFTEQGGDMDVAIQKIADATLEKMRKKVSKLLANALFATMLIFGGTMLMLVIGSMSSVMAGSDYIQAHAYDRH